MLLYQGNFDAVTNCFNIIAMFASAPVIPECRDAAWERELCRCSFQNIRADEVFRDCDHCNVSFVLSVWSFALELEISRKKTYEKTHRSILHIEEDAVSVF